MATKFILKNSGVPDAVPSIDYLDYGELAINYADGKLYYNNANDGITVLNAAVDFTVATSMTDSPSSLLSIGVIPTKLDPVTGGWSQLELTGNQRGAAAIDIQSARAAITQVASGTTSLALGMNNTASNTTSFAIGSYVKVGTANTLELGLWPNADVRGGAVRIHNNGTVAISTIASDTAYTDGSTNYGSESSTSLMRTGSVFRYSPTTGGLFVDHNDSCGCVKTYSLALATPSTNTIVIGNTPYYTDTRGNLAIDIQTERTSIDNIASGEGQILIGRNNTVGSGQYTSLIGGLNTVAGSQEAVSVFGYNNMMPSDGGASNSVIVGANNTFIGASNKGFIIGDGNNNSNTDLSIVLGSQNTMSGASVSIAIGYGNANSGGITIGEFSRTYFANCVAIGNGAYAHSPNSIAIGNYAQTTNVYGTNENSIAIGNDAVTYEGNCTAIGYQSGTGYEIDAAVAIGQSCRAYGNRSISLGIGSLVVGANSICISSGDNFADGWITGDNTIAIGKFLPEHPISGDKSIIIGNEAGSTANYTTAIGYRTQTTVANTVELSTRTEANPDYRQAGIRIHGDTGMVNFTVEKTDTAYTAATEASSANGSEANGQVIFNGLAFRVTSDKHLIAQYNDAGTILSLDLGEMTA